MKKIHDILFNSATPQEQAAMLEQFAGECELLSGLHHPCIVQFLGVCFEQGFPLPVLVMEYLHTTLSACLEKYGVLPKEISYGILRYVALGLRYLHKLSPPIIHRDLLDRTERLDHQCSNIDVYNLRTITKPKGANYAHAWSQLGTHVVLLKDELKYMQNNGSTSKYVRCPKW